MSLADTLRLLLPRARAWRAAFGSRVRAYLDGLAGEGDAVRTFADEVLEDIYPATTRYPELWERQFGLPSTGSDAVRRARIAAEWAATGGQSPDYLQGVVQAAGFDLWIHDWWSSGPGPYVARDPRDYTIVPLVGTIQCGEALAQCGEPIALCNAFLANDPGYLVNLALNSAAPPPVPADPDTWPFFIYWGGETFGTNAEILSSRRAELERLLLKLCPAHCWIVVMADYVADLIDTRITEGGDRRITEGGDVRITE